MGAVRPTEFKLLCCNIPVFDYTNDLKRFSAPMGEGIYMLGQCIVNQSTGLPMCLIKIGMSTNVPDRMKSYQSTNPLLYHIDFLKTEKADEIEVKYQTQLLKYAQARCYVNQEWYLLPQKVYQLMCEQGLKFFDNPENEKYIINHAKDYEYQIETGELKEKFKNYLKKVY